MDQFIQFVINHWMLWLALVVIVALLVMQGSQGMIKGVQKIMPQAAVNLINHENATIIDVRGDAEYGAGHITASIHVPYDALEQKLGTLNKDKPVIVVCGNGQISPKAGAILVKQGFTKVYFIAGGIVGWQRAGLPLTQD